MIRHMDINKSSGTAQVSTTEKQKPKRYGRLNINTLEYGIIANLVMQQYQQEEEVKFDALLSIPLPERIPGLMEAYGKKTMHKLLLMILKEFSASLPLPKAKKLSDTKLSMLACELMLSSFEDYLSLEDVIIFLQRAKAGMYGVFKNFTQPAMLLDKMEAYRQARHEVYMQKKEEKDAAMKALGNAKKTSSEPTQFGDLLQQAFIIDISNRA